MPSHVAFEAHNNYWAAMAVAKVLLTKGLISRREYLTIETKIKLKWAPFFSVSPG